MLLLIGGAAFVILSGGGSDKEKAAPPVASTNVDLKPGTVTVEWPGFGPSAITEGVSDQVMAAMGEYVDKGLVPSLRGEKVEAADLSGAFDEAAIARISDATSRDRQALFDEGVPKAIGKLKIGTTSVPLTALNDTESKTLFVSATIALKEQGTNDKGKFTIRRVGELVFAPDAAGTWKISGWSLLVDRTGAGFPASTSPDASAATTTTTVETP